MRPEKFVIMKELVTNFNKNLLEPVLFERLDSIRISCSKYLVTSIIDFSVYRQSFASLLNYPQLLLQNVQDLMSYAYSKMINL